MGHNSAADSKEPPEEPQEKAAYLQEYEKPGCRWRGVRWRVMLGVLPLLFTSIDELRRAAANVRRRYAELRRQLLVDPHILEEVQKTDHVAMDNPLSQDPESVWGRYFQNAELQRTIDNDLTRLYPEHESFFQSPACQAILRRILLVWALIHPNYSYRQGMHELLAPLLYVLYVDALRFYEVKQRYGDLFDDRFDIPLDQDPGACENGRTRRATNLFAHKALLVIEGCKVDDTDEWAERIAPQDSALLEPDEFGFDLRTMVLGSDTYGAEGELGALLSGRFIEHDAYCMFDALMNGQGGAVAMAEYFMNSNGTSLSTGMPPVLEASSVLYRALAAADVFLYRHLVTLHVEPQFFALRWLRVLFGREFIVEKLLILWDAIFAVSNAVLTTEEHHKRDIISRFSQRSAFISAVAVSMLLYLRPTLLAAADGTTCLQKLLNFPQTVDIRSLIENAKMLQPLAEEALKMMPSHIVRLSHSPDQTHEKLLSSRSVSPPSQGHQKFWHQTSCSPELLKYSLPETYWEEKWKSSMLQKVVHNGIGTQGPETGKAVWHDQSVSHDLTVDSTGRTKGKERQQSSVREMLYAVNVCPNDVNKTFRSEIFDVTGQTRKNKEAPLDMPLNLCEVFDSEQQPSGDIDDTSMISDNPPHLQKTALAPASPCEHLLALEDTSLVPAGGVPPRLASKNINDAESSELSFPVLNEESSIEHDDQSSAFSDASEGRENIGSNLLEEKSKGSSIGSRTSRFFRFWNFTRNQTGDKKIMQKREKALSNVKLASGSNSPNATMASSEEGALETRDEMHLCNVMVAGDDKCAVQSFRRAVEEQELLYESAMTKGCHVPLMSKEMHVPSVPLACTDKVLSEVTSEISDVSLLSNERGTSTVPQTLGRSMLGHIQVLETAFSQQSSLSDKESLIGTIPISKEKSENSTKASLSKDQIAALEALVDLRRISNILLQM